jgi:phosphatidylserine/phosphatidylglycerophosphate/cardiolipin synthase-like enzyme
MFGAMIPLLLFFNFFFFTPKETAIYSTDLNDALQKAITTDLYEAKESITLLTYTLSDPAVMKALKNKKKEGLDVRVMIDCKASPQARYLVPEIDVKRRACKGLMHYKLLVIDHRYVWVGSANYTGDSLKLSSNVIERLDNPELAKEIEKRYDSFVTEGPFHNVPPIIQDKLEFWFLPDSDGVTRIKQLMRGAQKSIKVAMYTFTRKDFADTLVRAKNRGVNVEVVMDKGMAEGASKRTVDFLKMNGIPVYIRKGEGLMHNKFMLIDDNIWVHGSANWTRMAFTQNDDYFIVHLGLNSEKREEVLKIWQALLQKSN